MAGPAFYWIATWVKPRTPQFAVMITQSDSFKKDYQLLDTNAVWRYDLTFSGVSDSGRNAIMKHYSGYHAAAQGGGVTGPYEIFSWTSCPSYVNAPPGGMNVRYIGGSYNETPGERSWNIRLSFERDM